MENRALMTVLVARVLKDLFSCTHSNALEDNVDSRLNQISILQLTKVNVFFEELSVV